MYVKNFEEIKNSINVRQNLSEIRSLLKEQKDLLSDLSDEDLQLILNCLSEDDAKARKNAAQLLGDIGHLLIAKGYEAKVLAALWKAYEMEQTLFVRSFYLKAMEGLPVEELQLQLEKRFAELSMEDWEEGDLKHIREERRALQALLPQQDYKWHKFHGIHKPYEVLLTAEPFAREALQKSIDGETKLTPRGVRTSIKSDYLLRENRIYKECLFLVPIKRDYPLLMESMSDAILQSGFVPMLREFFEGEGPVAFRLVMTGLKSGEHFPNQVKRISCELEEKSQGYLKNLNKDYEVELRLVQKKDEAFMAYLLLKNPEDQRFTYRKNVVATSMAPSTAASVVALMTSYLKEGVQILDPFAGVGTLLVERCKAVPAREIYAIDTFGEAVAKGRENVESASLAVNYINRSFFDFTHDYLFDEIITEFPDLYDKNREEVEEFYASFFEKVMEVTAREAMLFLISSEGSRIKKHLRLNKELRLERELEIRNQTSLFVIRRKDV